MTDANHTPGEVLPVTAGDREAAANLVVPYGRWPGFPSDFRSGRADGNELTQAFARHLLASTPPASGNGAAADIYERCAQIVEAWRGPRTDSVGFAYNTAREQIAARIRAKAIRALPAEPSPSTDAGLMEVLERVRHFINPLVHPHIRDEIDAALSHAKARA